MYSPYGHVAVITNFDIDSGFIEICEENNNQKWANPASYSRRIALWRKEGLWYITDTEKLKERDYLSSIIYDDVIRWKRVIMEENQSKSNTSFVNNI